ncbi:vWA domain-containing protein, partial [Alkalilacustris brevis]|uniref:vWA domain-containing protein n=1 Tax=Alkalilacustris brevis TaxID=2026338 RepID=UPI00192E455E
MRRLTAMAMTTALLGAPLAAQERAGDHVAIMVFDASGSMWNRLEGDLTRIEIARDVMEEYFETRDASVPLGVVAYGHTRRGDCSDIEAIAPLSVHDGAELTARLRALNPQGMTPLTDSMAMARDMIPPTAESADLILFTDGLENCGGDPCALAAELAAQGIGIRAHVVGFGMTEDEVNTLSCLPEQTGGMLFHTNSGAELSEAMTAVSAPAPQPIVEETPPPEPELPEVSISGPDSARAGESFRVQWS